MADQTNSIVLNKPNINTSDNDLITISTQWMLEAEPFHAYLKRIQNINEQYYFGNQTLKGSVPGDLSDAVQNQIFMGIETAVPIITANPPQFIVEPPEDAEVSGDYAYTLQKILGMLYETLDIRSKGEFLIRTMVIYRFGVWKPYWDYKKNNVNVRAIRPQRLYIPKYGMTEGELPYVIEAIDMTYDEIRDQFGEEKFKIFLNSRGVDYAEGEKGSQTSPTNPLNAPARVKGTATIYEYWTTDMVFWKYGGMIMDKMINPHFDFENIERNHFDIPRIPYIIASIFKLGNSVVGDTDLVTQTIPIQDVINVTTRTITNNAIKMGNGTWLVDSDIMTEEEARNKLTNAPGLVVWGSEVANVNKLRRDAPPAFPEYIYTLKVTAEKAFDNIFGTHSTTRGERGSPETLGGRLLLKQADLGRMDLVVREYERCVALLGEWFVQLMKLNFAEKRTFRIYGETGLEFVSLAPAMIERGIRVIVKSGTTLPTDELSKRREAIELWQQGALDPVTLYERLKFPNPEEAAQKLLAWKKGQLEMQASVAEGATPAVQPKGIVPTIAPNQEIGEAVNKIT